jgi:hypothetical protein
MKNSGLDHLKRVIESQHGGTATFAQSVRVHEAPRGNVAWDGVVHVFNLADNPDARRAYAWSAPVVGGGGKDRYFAVLHKGRVTGPLEAVKAAVVAVRTWGKA